MAVSIEKRPMTAKVEVPLSTLAGLRNFSTVNWPQNLIRRNLEPVIDIAACLCESLAGSIPHLCYLSCSCSKLLDPCLSRRGAALAFSLARALE